ncbi:MAG: hypothetical protein R3E14_12220 [Erythrobacter sp.]
MNAATLAFIDAGNVSDGQSTHEKVGRANGGVLIAEFVGGASDQASGICEVPEIQADISCRRLTPTNKSVDEKYQSGLVIDAGRAFLGRVVGKRSIHTLQEWEGVVERVDRDKFSAQLWDLTVDRRNREFADIPISLVNRVDRSDLKEGAIFRLIVGVAVTDKGNRINDAVVYFRKLRGANVGAEVAKMIRSFPED